MELFGGYLHSGAEVSESEPDTKDSDSFSLANSEGMISPCTGMHQCTEVGLPCRNTFGKHSLLHSHTYEAPTAQLGQQAESFTQF